MLLPQVIKLILRSNGYDIGESSALDSDYLTDEECVHATDLNLELLLKL